MVDDAYAAPPARERGALGLGLLRPEKSAPDAARLLRRAGNAGFPGAVLGTLKDVLVRGHRRPVPPTDARAALRMFLAWSAVQYGSQMLAYPKGSAKHSFVEQWVLPQSCDEGGCTQRVLKLRLAPVILGVFLVVRRLLNWSNPASV